MADLRPDTTYNPNQTVSPSTNAGNDYLSVRSNPGDFGANIGEATQGFGKTLGQASETQTQINLQQQGLANEHAANMAEIKSITDGGEIETQFKNLKGLEAYNARGQYAQQYLQLNQKIRDGLGNPEAQKAFDQLINRRVGFTIQGMNDYAHTEQNNAYKQGNIDSAQLSLDRMGSYDVATNQNQFNYEQGNVIHQANTLYTAPGHGLYQNTPATQDPKTGMLKYDTSTPEGQLAQASYDNYIDKQLGTGYENATKIIAFDPKNGNIGKAVDFLEDHKNDMKPATYARLSSQLSGPYRNEQSRNIVEGQLDQAHEDYSQSAGLVNPSSLSNAFLQQESGNGKTSTNLGQIQPGTWQQFAKPGEDINNPNDNKAVTQRILTQYSKDYFNDPSRIAVAYFSGPGNVAPVGSPTPWKQDSQDANGKSVSSYVADIKNRIGVAPTIGGNLHQTEADYLGDHEPALIEQARGQAAKQGFDSIGQDMAADKMRARIAEKRSIQNNEVHSLSMSVLGKVTNDKNPITNEAFLDNSQDQNLRSQWERLQALDPYKSNGIRRIIQANAEGHSATFGTDFYSHYNDVLTGKTTDISQLQDYVGGNKSPVSNTGLKAIKSELDNMATPQGQAFAAKERAFLDDTKKTVTGQKFYPGADSSVLNSKFQTQLMSLIPQIQAKRADLVRQGKDPSTMFDPNDKENYVGKNITQPSKAEIDKVMFSSAISGTPLPQFATTPNQAQPQKTDVSKMVFKTTDDVGAAWQRGDITEAEADAVIKQRFGGYIPRVPKPQ